MAINTKKAAKPTKSVKTQTANKKAIPAPKKIVSNKVKQGVKKAPVKAVGKKTAIQPATKKAAVKPVVKKAIPVVKKVTPIAKKTVIKKTASTNNQQTVNKKNSKPAPKATNTKKEAITTKTAPAKKAAPAKKVAPAPKAVPVKKAAPVAKKVETKKVVTKPAPKAPEKPIAKKAVAPAPPPAPSKPVAKGKTKAKVVVKQMPVKPAVPLIKPMATPAARPVEKKPTVVIAHRKLENKSKPSKASTIVSTDYQPDTYRSILDEVPEPIQSTIYRYSDEELNEFKQIIITRLDAARKELNYLQGLITRKDEAGTEDTENRFMNMEDGSGAMEREQLAQLASRQIMFMNHLEKALVRIENKTYGVCRVTGKLIDKARLRAVPHATLSIEAKNTMTK
jgi:RNA polymerase-binding transcription factor DksA